MELKQYFKTLKYKEGLSDDFKQNQINNLYNSRLLMPNQMDYIAVVNDIELNFIEGLKSMTGYVEKRFDILKLLDLIHPQDFDKCMKFIKIIFNKMPEFDRTPFACSANLIYRLNIKGGKTKTIMRKVTSAATDRNGQMTAHYSINTDISPLPFKKVKAWWSYKGQNHPLPLSDTLDVNFTKREMEILKLIAKGFLSKEIANKLTIEKTTVDKHRQNMMVKAKVINSHQLLGYAYEHDIIDPDY